METLKKVDPKYAEEIRVHDSIRMARALEVYYQTGKPFSSFRQPINFHLPRDFGRQI